MRNLMKNLKKSLKDNKKSKNSNTARILKYAALLGAFCAALALFSACGNGEKSETPGSIVPIDGDKITGVWIVGGDVEEGNGKDISEERLSEIISAHNAAAETKEYTKISEKDTEARVVLFSERTDGEKKSTTNFLISYIGDYEFSVSVSFSGGEKSEYDIVSKELFKALNKKTTGESTGE